VGSRTAIEILEAQHADAAGWWRAHAPHMLQPGRHFVFAEACGERIDPGREPASGG
jgi:hypothetical protein